jgi:fructose-bisphosphate aldolase class I
VHLDAINRRDPPQPWQLRFSYGRALQDPVLHAWKGQAGNALDAQKALLLRARLNSLACQGKYSAAMESPGG